MSTTETVNIALAFMARDRRFHVFPIRAAEKDPPLLKDNLNVASNDPKVIAAWHAKWPGCNWGLALKKSGVIAMDVDVKAGKIGQQTLDTLTLEYGQLPETLTVQTPSGGRHYYFIGEHRFGLGKFGFGTDLDSPNYVIVPGCTLAAGGEYTVINDVPMAEAPAWFGELLGQRRPSAGPADQTPRVDLDLDSNVARAIDYLRNGAPPSRQGSLGDATLINVAAVLKDMAISEWFAVELLTEHYNNQKCDPPWNIGGGGPDDMVVKVHNAYQYAVENPPGSATPEYEFRDDLVSVEEMKTYAAMWDKLVADQAPKRATARARVRQQQAQQQFADEMTRPLTQAEMKARREQTAERRRRKEQGGEPETLDSLLRGWCYIGQQKCFVRKRDGMMWDSPAFDPYFSHIEVPDKRDTTLISKHLLSRPPGHQHAVQKFDTFAYAPGAGENVNGAYNQYVPSDIEPKEGDTSLWDLHLAYLFPDESDRGLVLNWLAWVLQNLDKKPKHALFIRGEMQGTGKSFIGDVFGKLIGEHNVTPIDQGDFETPHNGYQSHTKLMICEEVRSLSLPAYRRLLGWITQLHLHINEKNVKQFTIPDLLAYLFFSNKMDALPIDDTDRRYLIIETLAKRMPLAYYCRLFDLLDDPDALAAIKHQLLNRDLGTYTAAGPAPYTAAKGAMVEESATDLQSYMTMMAGAVPFCYSLATIDEVMLAIPKHYLPHARKFATVRDVLHRRFNGLAIGSAIQTGARKADQNRVWALGSSPERVAALVKMSWADLSALYQAEHKGGAARADAAEADDFGPGG